MTCPFCTLDIHDFSNTIIDKSDDFLILPSKGSLCDGYLLIVPKKHINSMNELTTSEKEKLISLIKNYREKFHQIYSH